MKQIRRKTLPGALLRAFGAGVALSVVATAAHAQQAQRVEKIEVTGSNIKRVDAEGPSPVAVIKREDLERSASQNLQDVLQNLTVSNTGSFGDSLGTGNTFAPGSAGISLRGLGSNTTLVLLNGRRVANYGFAQNINVAFVDLNSIPVSAIERIEILKDGASAIYGSDAIAGVVNIILRKDFRGLELGAGFGTSSEGDADETRATATFGFGDLARQRFNVMGTLDYYKRDPLFGGDRSFSRTADQRSRGGLDRRSPTGSPGTWLTAGRGGFTTNTNFPDCPAESAEQALNPLGICAYNFQGDVFILAQTERKGAMGRAVFEVTPNFSLFAELGYNENDSLSRLAPTPDSFTLPVGHNSNPYPFAVPITYRFTDVGARISNQLSETTRFVVGAKGSVRNWDWEAAYVNGNNKIEELRSNFVARPERNALVAANVYNFVNPSANDPALAAALRASPVRRGESNLESLDAKLTGSLMEMAGGPLGMAVGIEHRREDVKDVPDPLGAANLIIGAGGTAADGARRNTGVYGELSIPFAKNIEAQVAIRHERYNDFGDSTVPKYALSWRPMNNVLLRAGFNKGFRAPSLAELYLGQSVSFPTFVDSTRCAAYRTAFGTADPRTGGACASLQVRTITGGNPNLTAEKSENESMGVVWDATPNLSLALDYWRISHTQRIATPNITFVVANEGLFPGAIVRDPQTANDVLAGARGPIIGSASDERTGMFLFYFNAQSRSVRGYDFEARYRMNLGNAGRMDLISTNTYLEYLRQATAPGQPATEFASTAGVPRYRGNHSVIWGKGAWDASATVNVIGAYRQPVAINGILNGVASWTTLDLQASFKGWKGLKLAVGVRNALDNDPSFYDDNPGFDTSIANPIGRFYYGRVSYTFR